METLQLTQVDFRGNIFEGLITALEEGKLPALKTLHLSEVYCDKHSLEKLAVILNHFKTKEGAVVHLGLSSRRTFDEEGERTSFGLAGMDALSTALQGGAGNILRSLEIELATMSDAEVTLLCQGIKKSPNIASLGFTKCEFFEENSADDTTLGFCELLAEPQYLPKLESFTLLKKQYTRGCFVNFINALLARHKLETQLKKLVLCHVGMEVRELLDGFKKGNKFCPSLRSLTLSGEELLKGEKEECVTGIKKCRPELEVLFETGCVIDMDPGNEFTDEDNDGFKYGEGGDADYVDESQEWFM